MYEALVERGMALLDQHHPGWESRLDLDMVQNNMHDYTYCVIGQLSGDEFSQYTESIGLVDREAWDAHGFALPLDHDDDGRIIPVLTLRLKEQYAPLGLTWRVMIEARLGINSVESAANEKVAV